MLSQQGYEDVRFLVLDLDVAVKDKEQPEAKAAANESPVPGTGMDETDMGGESQPGGPLEGGLGEAPGGVSVEVDRVTRPGAVASGSVSFSDGTNATWMIDQLGRVALDAGGTEYRPSEDDLAAFQMELQKAFSSRGL